MKTIPLTRGMVAIVDDADYAFLTQWKWMATSCRDRFYAARFVQSEGKRRCILMHRLIAGAVPGQEVDHKDKSTLNNQRDNLRTCTRSQNLSNSKLYKQSKSGFKHVTPLRCGRWAAWVTVNKKSKWLGSFESPEMAAKVADKASLEQYGEFCSTNKSLGMISE